MPPAEICRAGRRQPPLGSEASSQAVASVFSGTCRDTRVRWADDSRRHREHLSSSCHRPWRHWAGAIPVCRWESEPQRDQVFVQGGPACPCPRPPIAMQPCPLHPVQPSQLDLVQVLPSRCQKGLPVLATDLGGVHQGLPYWSVNSSSSSPSSGDAVVLGVQAALRLRSWQGSGQAAGL